SDNDYPIGSSNRVVTVCDMRADEGDAYAPDTWSQKYAVILNANHIIATEIVTGGELVINDRKRQAKLARAVCHFDLMKLYGQQHIDGQGRTSAITVPYVTVAPLNSTDAVGFSNERSTLDELRTYIYKDLDDAIAIINNSANKTKITKQAALGYKSRIALYFAAFYPADYQLAYDAAVAAIAEGGSVGSADNFIAQFSGNVPDVNSVFEFAMPSDDHLGNT